MKSIFHIDYCTCHDRNVCRQTINKTVYLWLQHITKHTITSAWPSAYCRHSAVMTLQSPELRPLRWRGEECNQSIFSSALSFAYSQKAITGCSCKHFAPQHPWDTQSKRITAISLFFSFFLFAQRKPMWIHFASWMQWRGQNTQNSPWSWIRFVFFKRDNFNAELKATPHRIPSASVVDVQYPCNLCV